MSVSVGEIKEIVTPNYPVVSSLILATAPALQI